MRNGKIYSKNRGKFSLLTSRAKPALAAKGLGKAVRLTKAGSKHRGDYKLGDPLAVADLLGLITVVMQRYDILATIVAIDHPNLVGRR